MVIEQLVTQSISQLAFLLFLIHVLLVWEWMPPGASNCAANVYVCVYVLIAV